MQKITKTAKAPASKTTKTPAPVKTAKDGTKLPGRATVAPAAKKAPPAPKPVATEKGSFNSAPAPVRASQPSDGLARLRVGDIVMHAGEEYAVYYISESRAKIAPLSGRIEGRKGDDGMIRFIGEPSADISPNSELEIIRSLGRPGLAEYLEERKKQQTEENMKAKTEKKAAKAPKEKREKSGTPGVRSAGALGSYKGFSVASVVRRLGKEGWNAAEVRAFLDAEKLEASEQTIKLNLYRARKDSGHELAPLTKEQLPKKPVVEAKTKKAPAPEKKAEEEEAPATAPAAKKVEPAKASAKPAPAPAKKAAPSKAAEQIAALKAKKASAKSEA